MRITILFFLLFCPYIALGGRALPVGYAFYFLIIIYAFFTRSPDLLRNLARDIGFQGAFIYSVYGLSVIIFGALFARDVELRLLRMALDPLILILAARATIILYSIKYGSDMVQSIIRHLTILLLINSVVIILSFISIPFRETYYSIIAVTPKIFEYPVPRYSGFLYDGFSYSSTLIALILLVIVGFYIFARKSSPSVAVLLTFALSIISSLLAGRTGVLLLIIFFSLFFLSQMKTSLRALHRNIASFKKYIITLGLVIAVFTFVYDPEQKFFEILSYSSRLYTNFFDTMTIQDYTLQELSDNHYFIPNEVIQLLFGAGYFLAWPSGVTRPDPAVTLTIFAFGLIGLLIFWFTLISMAVKVYKRSELPMNLRVFFGIIVFLFIVLCFKDAYLFYPYPHFFLLFLFYYTIMFRAQHVLSLMPQSRISL